MNFDCSTETYLQRDLHARNTYMYLHWIHIGPINADTASARHLSWHVTSHPGQLTLAIPSWVGAMNTSQRAVTPCG